MYEEAANGIWIPHITSSYRSPKISSLIPHHHLSLALGFWIFLFLMFMMVNLELYALFFCFLLISWDAYTQQKQQLNKFIIKHFNLNDFRFISQWFLCDERNVTKRLNEWNEKSWKRASQNRWKMKLNDLMEKMWKREQQEREKHKKKSWKEIYDGSFCFDKAQPRSSSSNMRAFVLQHSLLGSFFLSWEIDGLVCVKISSFPSFLPSL